MTTTPEDRTDDPLVLEGVTKHYANGFTLDVDLRVPRGYVMGLVGANGSGKTTAIRCALGLARPDAGRVHLLDKARVGVVLDTPAYHPAWTVAQTGRLLAPFFPVWDADRFAALTDGWGVPGNRSIKDLSRGMAMKLQVAVALSHRAEFLVLDEPTSGLDPLSRDEFLQRLADFMTDERHSALFSSHLTGELDRLADFVAVMDAGRVVACAERDVLLDSYRLAAGGPGDLPAGGVLSLIGLRRHDVGWDALVRTDEADVLPPGTQVEVPTLNDLVVRMAKEHSHA